MKILVFILLKPQNKYREGENTCSSLFCIKSKEEEDRGVPSKGTLKTPKRNGSCPPRCWEPAWGIPPVTRSCGRALMARLIRPQVFPLEFPEHPPQRTRVCLLYCVMLSTYSSDINRGLSPHHIFLEKFNLELLDNKYPGHNKSVSIPKPLWWLSSLLPDSYSCACDCLRPPDLERHRKLKTS